MSTVHRLASELEVCGVLERTDAALYRRSRCPVFGAGGHVVAALEPTVNDLREDLPTVQPALLVAARTLSRECSWARQPESRAVTCGESLLNSTPGRRHSCRWSG